MLSNELNNAYDNVKKGLANQTLFQNKQSISNEVYPWEKIVVNIIQSAGVIAAAGSFFTIGIFNRWTMGSLAAIYLGNNWSSAIQEREAAKKKIEATQQLNTALLNCAEGKASVKETMHTVGKIVNDKAFAKPIMLVLAQAFEETMKKRSSRGKVVPVLPNSTEIEYLHYQISLLHLCDQLKEGSLDESSKAAHRIMLATLHMQPYFRDCESQDLIKLRMAMAKKLGFTLPASQEDLQLIFLQNSDKVIK